MRALQDGRIPAPLGILMLDTRFPRPRGDIGNPESFRLPVLHRVVTGAEPSKIVASPDRMEAHLPGFVAAARALEAEGARAITTSCGFLVLAQDALAAAVGVPVVTSALLLAPLLRAAIGPDRTIGVVTADAGHLSRAHLAAAGIGADWRVAVRGMEAGPAFAGSILANAPTLDERAVARELVDLCLALQADTPDLGAILLECTNLPPYAGMVRAATGLPVWGILDAVALLAAGTDHSTIT